MHVCLLTLCFRDIIPSFVVTWFSKKAFVQNLPYISCQHEVCIFIIFLFFIFLYIPLVLLKIFFFPWGRETYPIVSYLMKYSPSQLIHDNLIHSEIISSSKKQKSHAMSRDNFMDIKVSPTHGYYCKKKKSSICVIRVPERKGKEGELIYIYI